MSNTQNKYINSRDRRSNPSLVIILLDQSIQMRERMSNGITLSENAINIVNSILSHLTERYVINSDCSFALVFEYGNEEAKCILSGRANDWMDQSIDGNWIRQPSPCTDVSVSVNNYTSQAFSIALETMQEWLEKRKSDSKSYGYGCLGHFSTDPVPVVFNITYGCPYEDMQKTKEIVSKIKQLYHPDGSPLVYNVYLSSNSNTNLFLNIGEPSKLTDIQVKFLYEISSVAPQYETDDFHYFSSSNIEENDKLFLMNPVSCEVNKITSVLDVPIHEWGGMYVGRPDPVLTNEDFK